MICRTCGAEIFFVVTGAGKRMPLDAAPVATGNVVIAGERVRVLRKGEAHEGPRYQAHFVVCPGAKKWRK